MRIIDDLLADRYRYDPNCEPSDLTESQREARRRFISEIHLEQRYLPLEKCPFCSHQEFIRISGLERRRLPADIVICHRCEGCFKASTLDPGATALHYQEISYALRGKDRSAQSMRSLFLKRIEMFAEPRYNLIQHVVGLSPAQGPIVELGAGDGANLYPWKERGFNVLGMDLDRSGISIGAEAGITLLHGDLEEFSDLVPDRPALIILSHVLEHVTDASAILRRLHSYLRPTGYLFIEVPGIFVWAAGDPLLYFDIEHNYNFDWRTLENLLEREQFSTLYGSEYIRAICTPAENPSAPELIRRRGPRSSLKKMSANVLSYIISRMRGDGLHDFLRTTESRTWPSRIQNRLTRIQERLEAESMMQGYGGSTPDSHECTR